jgi:hypothetical protein
MKLTGRKAHILFVRVADRWKRNTGELPSSSLVAEVAGVHPSTARRWLADLRSVLPAEHSIFRKGFSR